MPQGSSLTKIRPILESPNHTPTNSNVDQKTKDNHSQSKEAIVKQSNVKPEYAIASKIGSMNKSQLAEFVSNAREKGFTPSKLAKLCYQIDALQKKYGMNYDEIKSMFGETAKALDAKNNELKKLNAEISGAIKKKNDLMQQYYLD